MEARPIVFDAGSHLTKAGFAGENTPNVLVRTIVAHRHVPAMPSLGLAALLIGEDYLPRAALYRTRYPVSSGFIDSYDDMISFYGKVYERLGVASEEQGAMVVESNFAPFATREWQMQTFFETFDVRSYYADSAAVMSLRSVGKKSGMAIEMGDGKTQICAVLHGHLLTPGTLEFIYSGSSIDNFIIKLLTEREYQLTSKAREEVRRCKETLCNKLCLSSSDFDQLNTTDSTNKETSTYRFGPEDATEEWKFTAKERFSVPEILFNPGLLGGSYSDLASVCYSSRESLRAMTNPKLGVYETNPGHNASLKTPYALPQETTQAILDGKLHDMLANEWHLFGGGSMFENLEQRLQSELRAHINPEEANSINVIAAPDRQYSAWKGASMLASDPSYSSICISRDDYDEYGPSIIHRRSYGGLVEIR